MIGIPQAVTFALTPVFQVALGRYSLPATSIVLALTAIGYLVQVARRPGKPPACCPSLQTRDAAGLESLRS